MNFTPAKSKSFSVPTLCWIAFTAVMLILMSTGERKHHSLPRTLIQWDGQHYLSIAASGYEKFPCPEDPTLICGNVGWFPMYPMVSKAVGALTTSTLGINIRWALLLTSMLCLWGALLLLYRLTARRYGDRAATVTVIALLLFPSSFYFFTAFPYSLYLLLALTVFTALERENYLAAAVPAGLLAVTYPSGIVIALPLLFELIRGWRRPDHQQTVSAVAALATVGLALFLYGFYYWWRFDDFFLYAHFQAKPYYAHQATVPLIPIIRSLTSLPLGHPVFLMLVFIVIVTAAFYSRKIPATWQIYMFAVLLFTPTFGTTTSYYRHIIVAFPLFAMIGIAADSNRRKWLLPVYAVASLGLMWFVYLKYYKLGMLM